MIIRIGVGEKKVKDSGYNRANFSVYVIDINKNTLSDDQLKKIGESLTNQVTHNYYIFIYDQLELNYKAFDTKNNYNLITFLNANWSLEIAFLPNVTDNIGNTAKQIISESLKYCFDIEEAVHSSRVIFGRGNLPTEEEISTIYNPLTQYCKLSHKSDNDSFFVKFFGNDNITQLNSLYKLSQRQKSIFPIPYVRHQDLFPKKKAQYMSNQLT